MPNKGGCQEIGEATSNHPTALTSANELARTRALRSLKDDPSLYSGLVWTGEEGVALGLVDALGSSSYVAREVIGAEDIVDFTHQVPCSNA